MLQPALLNGYDDAGVYRSKFHPSLPGLENAMLRYASLSGILIAGSLAQASDPQPWAITTQERRSWATATAGFDGELATETTELFGDFGLFEGDARAGFSFVDSTGLRALHCAARAAQHSILTTRSIRVNSIASGGTFITGSGGEGESDAWTQFEVQFSLPDDGHFRLNGFIDCGGGGQARLQLSGPAGFNAIDIFNQGTYDEFLGEVLIAPAGGYRLYVDAFADTLTVGSGSDDQLAEVDIELTLLSCGSPVEPIVKSNVAYALTDAPGYLHRSLGILEYQDWSRIGESSFLFGDGLGIHPISSEFYVLRTIDLFPAPLQILQQLNPLNGESISNTTHSITFLTPLHDSDLFDITFRPDGVLYGIWASGSSGMLGTVDPATGEVSLLGALGTFDPTYGAALAFDPVSGLLYNAAGANLYAIDLGMESITPVFLEGAPIIRGLAFHPEAGALIAGLHDGSAMTIDPNTGEVDAIACVGSINHPILGLTILPELVLDGALDECLPAPGSGADTNLDDQVDPADQIHLQTCISGPGGGLYSAGCISADMDEDGDADLFDIYKLQLLSGLE
jgi:hypothetical protein